MAKQTRGTGRNTPAAAGNGYHGPALEHGDKGDEPPRGKSALDHEEEREEAEILQAMRLAGGAGAYLRIERKRPNESEYSLICPRIPLENYADVTKLEDYLMSTFGGGDYKIQARKSGGAVVRAFPLRIDHSIPAKTPGEPKPKEQNDTASIVRELVTQLVPLLKPAAAPAQDNTVLVAMITAQSQMMTGIFTAFSNMNSRPQGSDPQLTTLLGRMERAIEKIGDANASPKQKSGAAEILELLEVMDRMRDSAETDAPTKGLLGQLGEAVAPIAKALLAGGSPFPNGASVLDPAGRNGAGPPASSPAARPGAVDVEIDPAAAAGGAATAETAPSETDAMNIFIRQALKQVAKQALSAADRAAVLATQEDKDAAAEDFALQLTPQIPEAADEQVKATLNDPNWLVTFFGNDPRVQLHAAWLGKVRQFVLEDLEKE